MGERLLSHKVNLLRKLGREEEAQQTIHSHLKCDEIVLPEIERLRDAGKLPEARDLVEKRMSVKGESEQSLEILLDIVKRQDDTPAVIETLYQLVLSVRYDLSYYRELKKWFLPLTGQRCTTASLGNSIRKMRRVIWRPFMPKKKTSIASISSLCKTIMIGFLSS